MMRFSFIFSVCTVSGAPLFHLFPWREVTASWVPSSPCVAMCSSLHFFAFVLSFCFSLFHLPWLGLFLKFHFFIYSLFVFMDVGVQAWYSDEYHFGGWFSLVTMWVCCIELRLLRLGDLLSHFNDTLFYPLTTHLLWISMIQFLSFSFRSQF